MIGQLLRHELRLRLFTPAWWLLAAGSWLICAWLLFAQMQVYQEIQPQLLAGGASLGVNDLLIAPTLNTLALLLLIVAPLLGMSAVAGERRSGRLPVLLSTPLSPLQLLLGKWLGTLLPLLLIVLGILAMLASLALGMHLAWDRLAVALCGLTLLGAAASAFSLLCSTLTRQPAGAFAVGLAGLVFLWLADSFFKPDSGAYWFALAPHLGHLLAGSLLSDDLAYFLSLTLAFLTLALGGLLRERERPPLQRLREALAVLLTGACLLGIAQLSQAQRHSLYRAEPLPQALSETLAALHGPVTVTAFAPDLPLLRARIQKLIAPLQEQYPALELRWVDPQQQPQLARELGIQHNGELRIEGMGRSQRITRLDYPSLLRAFRRIARHGEPWIVTLSGHGEAPLERTPRGIGAWVQALGEYGYRVIALAPDTPIPDNAALLLVAAPQQEYPPALQQRLHTWLGHGGRLLWLDEGKAAQTLHALSGVTTLPGTLVSPVRHTGLTPLQQTPAVPPDLVQDGAPAAVMDGTHALLPPERADWKLDMRIDSDAHAWNETGALQGEVRRDPLLGERSGPHAIGLLLQRGPARIAVLGDSDLARDALFGQGGNRSLLLGLVNWLTDNRLATASAANDIRIRWSPATGAALAVFHLLFGPLLLAALGLWIQRRRERA
jgi:ABC-2 type transport system permease protein